MIKKIKIILIIANILILLGVNNVFAASGSFSINKTSATIEIGATTTFSITATNCGGKFTITSSNTNVATVSSSGEWIEDTSKSITITAKSAGTATITITAADVASTDEEEVTGSKTIKITVPEKQSSSNNSNTGTGSTTTNNNTQTNNSTTTTSAKSSEARLKNLGINPKDYDFSGFKKDKTEYSVEVPNSVTSVEIYAEPVDSNAKVTGTGKVTLNEGNNKVGVTVTAEDGTTKKTYVLTIKRKTAAEEKTENGEARLKSLGIKPEEYDFSGFNSDNTEYSVKVPNDVKEIEVYATAIDSSAQITGTGMISLDEGENNLKIEVIATDGTKKVYTIVVTREETDEAEETTEEKFGLSILSIKGLELSPSFKVGTYEYTVELNEDLSSLEIEAEANNEEASVEIIGNEDLQQGENVITVLVKNDSTDDVATYQIIVNKNLAEEILETSWLKPSTWGKEEKIKIAIIVVLIILIISAIILKIKMGKELPKEDNVDFPGADELDKAIAEHQELSDDELEEVKNDEQEKYNSDLLENDSELNYMQDIAKKTYGLEEEDFDKKNKKRGRHF